MMSDATTAQNRLTLCQPGVKKSSGPQLPPIFPNLEVQIPPTPVRCAPLLSLTLL